MTLVDIDRLSPSELRHIAAAKEARLRRHIDELSDEAKIELADKRIAGRKPSLGWWRIRGVLHFTPRWPQPQAATPDDVPGMVATLHAAGFDVALIAMAVLSVGHDLDDEIVARVIAGLAA